MHARLCSQGLLMCSMQIQKILPTVQCEDALFFIQLNSLWLQTAQAFLDCLCSNCCHIQLNINSHKLKLYLRIFLQIPFKRGEKPPRSGHVSLCDPFCLQMTISTTLTMLINIHRWCVKRFLSTLSISVLFHCRKC